MKTIQTRAIEALTHHPRNADLYGHERDAFDQKLVDSLSSGIWPGEIQVTTGNVIISGHRRCDHAIFAGIEEAEVWVRVDLPEDPNSPEVLEALLRGNLQRSKTKEQQLREFELWLEVEKEQLKGKNQHTDASAQKAPQQKSRSRDAAAERVGLGNGEKAQQALKALKAADAAEATGDAEQVEKAKLVKRELAKSLGGAVRVAREQGLIAVPVKKSNRTPAVAQNPGALKAGDIPEPASTQQAEQAAAQDQQQGSANIKGREPLPEHLRQTVKKEQKRIKDRWLPIAQHLTAAHDLIRAEKERLGREYAGPYGSLIMQKRWQLMADELEASGIFAQFADATRRPDVTTLESLLLELERSSRMANGWITSLLFYTGCRPDPTRYKGGEQAGQ